MWGLSFDDWMMLFIIYWIVMLAILVIRKVRGRGKLRALILRPSMIYEVKAGSTEANKLKLSKDWIPTFKPSNIFEEKKPWYKFWRNPMRMVIVSELSKEAVGWKKPDAKDFSELEYNWTKSEIIKFIKKEVLKARMASKPMSNSMFFLLLIGNVGILMLVILGFARMGAF